MIYTMMHGKIHRATVTEANKDKYSWTGWNNMVTTQTTFVT